MKRGDLVTVALPGAYGKPRPAVVIQSDYFDALPSVTLLPVTSEIREAFCRVMLQPSSANGLGKPSQVMVDKVQTVPREKVGESFGVLDERELLAVTRTLAVFLGLG
jgi:mRNA interferase MazF